MLTVTQWLNLFSAEDGRRLLERLYGARYGRIEEKRRVAIGLLEMFRRRYGDRKVLLSRAPGRLNLMGRHIDHRGGFVNMLGLDRDILAVVAARSDRIVRIANADSARFPDGAFLLDELLPDGAADWQAVIASAEVSQACARLAGDWSVYVRAACAWLLWKGMLSHG